jgi:kynurenine 3-monooxygenase
MSFETLKSEENVREFFVRNFPDAFALMPSLMTEFFSNPVGTMVTVKGLPWHIEDRALLVGDAAHAVVPFYGQGMNCAFEDCHHVNRLVQRQMGLGRSPERMDWKELYVEFQKVRKRDTDAIADLAVENFVEMRDLVMQPKFQLKKKVERILEDTYPGLFVPQYTMVTFRRIPYSVARSRGQIQERILDELCANISVPEQLDLKRADVLIGRQLDYIE